MKKWISMVVLGVLVIFDQFTKYLAQANLQGKEGIPIIKNVLELHYLEGGNTGAAFGILEGKTVLLGIFSLLVSIVMLGVYFWMTNKKEYSKVSWCLIFMIAGAVGNCIDRLLNQYVIDFIYFKWIDFPIFNVADIYVTVSAIVMFLMILFIKEKTDSEDDEVRQNA